MTGSSLAERAVAILKANDRGGYTIPTAKLYPYQWNWDAGFTALGWATFDQARAWQELELLFKGQWSDGMLPHVVFHQQSPDYFPGPEVWGAEKKAAVPTSGISQPPIIASIVRWLLQTAKDTKLAQEQAANLYPKLYAYHGWWHDARDPHQLGLVCTYHPWETGRDNSAEWDNPFLAVPTTETQFQRRDTGLIDSAERPHQHEYQRYIYLVELFRSLNYDPEALFQQSPFKIHDVGINAILLRADNDLLELAKQFGTEQEQETIHTWQNETKEAFDKLWQDKLSCYCSYDLNADKLISLPTSAGFLPLFSGLPKASRALQMKNELKRWSEQIEYMVPSLAPGHALFEPKRYWRGPAWAMMNYMIALGLSDYGYDALSERIRRDTAKMTKVGEFHEYFNPLDGSGCGGAEFSWTAAIGLWWAFEK